MRPPDPRDGPLIRLHAGLGWHEHIPGSFGKPPAWLSIGIVVAMVLIHFVAAVGLLSTLIYGIARTGSDAAVTIRGRRFGGTGLGTFYVRCFASLRIVDAIALML